MPDDTTEDQATKENDFFAALLHEHGQIEARLEAFDQAATTASKAEGDAAALQVIAGTLRFFATEGARHQDHEELTLFPRLRHLTEFKQILSALEFQHRMNEDEGRALSACVERFAPGSGRELRRLAFRFAEAHRGHMIAEERALFPLAASALSPRVVAEMSREMLARKSAVGPTREAPTREAES